MARKLLDNGYRNFKIEMIGDGPLLPQVKESIRKLKVDEYVILHGAKPNDDVKKLMTQSHIFLFTSHRGEGWGVVLNEAMSAGCAVVASNLIGSVPYLIQSNHNGLVFESENVDSLYQCVKYLIDNDDERIRISKNAYQTIKEEWTPRRGAERFLTLAEHLLNGGHGSPFDDGLCSIALPVNPKSLISNL